MARKQKPGTAAKAANVTPQAAAEAIKPKTDAKPTKDKPSATCACGCGEPVARTFKQGHDQRLISLLASDLVRGDVWDGRCLAILTPAEVNTDIQGRIDKVTAYVRGKLSESLGTKVYNAAMRQWELQKATEERQAARAIRVAARNEAKAMRDAKKAEKKAAAPSVEAGAAPELKVITKATASNDDVDAAEAAAETPGQFKPGDSIRVKIGKRARNATVRGMNQAGKVTAVIVTTNGNETVKTEGEFTVIV